MAAVVAWKFLPSNATYPATSPEERLAESPALDQIRANEAATNSASIDRAVIDSEPKNQDGPDVDLLGQPVAGN